MFVQRESRRAAVPQPGGVGAAKWYFLIAMMKKFELCFPFERREDRYLIPDLLPKEEPVLNWDEAGAVAWEYHYDVLPGNVISRFIVRTGHLLPRDRLVYWRSGVVLDIDGSKARVKADSAAGRITVSILGREPSGIGGDSGPLRFHSRYDPRRHGRRESTGARARLQAGGLSISAEAAREAERKVSAGGHKD